MVNKTYSGTRAILLMLGLVLAGSAWAQQSREQQVTERIAPVGQVCVAGDPCAGGEATAAAEGGDGGGEFSPESVYQDTCATCHDTGMAGAPTMDDTGEWSSRLDERGFDGVLANAIDGFNAMPARGMCNDCSDEELSEVLEYMMGDALE